MKIYIPQIALVIVLAHLQVENCFTIAVIRAYVINLTLEFANFVEKLSKHWINLKHRICLEPLISNSTRGRILHILALAPWCPRYLCSMAA